MGSRTPWAEFGVETGDAPVLYFSLPAYYSWQPSWVDAHGQRAEATPQRGEKEWGRGSGGRPGYNIWKSQGEVKIAWGIAGPPFFVRRAGLARSAKNFCHSLDF